jgi:protein-disulfide isomerase
VTTSEDRLKRWFTTVKYGDYECPHCGQAYPIVEELQRRLGNRMRFVYRHFPLGHLHPHAESAAETAEAAGAQERFWEMHATLFKHQRELDAPHLLQYGAQLGIETAWLLQALATHAFRERVRDHFINGIRSGVNGTPTFLSIK